MKLNEMPKRKIIAIVACAPSMFWFPFCPNFDDSAATVASSAASHIQPKYRRERRGIRSVNAAPVNAPAHERMLFAKL